jgi:hypothetical protein
MWLSGQLLTLIVLLLWKKPTLPVEGGWIVPTPGIELYFLRHPVCNLVTMLVILFHLPEVYKVLTVSWS